MTPQSEESIFEAAATLTSPTQRAKFLDQACEGDSDLRTRLEALLAAHEEPDGLLGEGDEGGKADWILSNSSVQTERVGDMIGRYKLLEKIGEGGFGSVYMAEQSEPVRRRVALKIIKLGMDTKQVVARFEAERQALALMDHPNIASVFDAGSTETGRPFFVMELVKGMQITAFCNERRLDTKQRLRLFQQVCAALQHAHQKGIIHRDLKPSNIMVTVHGDDPVPKVIDFGIAKATQQQLTEKTLFTNFGQFVGTPAYMSPEQASTSGLDIDTRSDIYSLGVLLYELLTGQTPMDSQSLRSAGYNEICRLIQEQDPPRPSNRLNTLQEDELTEVARERAANPRRLGLLLRQDLDWVVMKALEKDPSNRYETAHGLSQDIGRFLNSEPVLAVAPSSFYRIRKLYRRHRVVASLVTAIAIALIAGVTISTWQAIRATRAESDARSSAAREKAARQAEQEQRQAAQQERRNAVEALFRSQFETADTLLSRDQTAEGVASLARVVRDHPGRTSAATRLISALQQRSFALPFKHAASENPVAFASVDPTGSRLVTLTPEGQARLWDLQSERLLWGPLSLDLIPLDVVYGPEGNHIAIRTQKTVHVLDATTGTPAGAVVEHEKGTLNAWFSKDGERLISGDTGGTAWVWSSGSAPPRKLDVHPGGWVKWCEFNADGSRLVTCSETRNEFEARVWDAKTGELLLSIDDFENAVQCARFTRDGRTVITASNDGTIRFYDASTGEETRNRIVHPHGGAFFRVIPSPDESRLLTVSILEYSARLWDYATGHPIGEPMLHRDRVYFATWSPDSKMILTKSNDRTARVWDANNGAPIVEPIRHHGSVYSVAFILGSERIMTTASNHNLGMWDIRAGREGAITMHHEEGLYGARFSPDGRAILSSSSDGTARLWDVHSGRMRVAPLVASSPDQRYVFDAQFNSNGSRIVTASSDQTARIWDAPTGTEILKMKVAEEHAVRVACFSPDDRVVATGSDDGMLGIWDAQSGRRLVDPIRAVPDEQGGWNMIWTIQFSQDGKTILTAGTDGSARLWNAQSGEAIGQPMRHRARVASAGFSPDEKRVLTASDDWTARQWDASTGQQIGPELSHDDHVTSAFYSPDGDLILTASEDGSVRLWDTQSGSPVVAPMRHGATVRVARFDPLGERIVTACEDGTARIWDARLGLPLSEPIRHSVAVVDACFNAEGTRILTASDAVRLWLFPPPLEAAHLPSWLPDWAESVVALRLGPKHVPEFVPQDEFFAVRSQITTSVESDFPTHLANWFFLDRSKRSLFLGSPVFE